MLGTYVRIELQGDADESLLNAWIEEGFAAVFEIDRLMSYHRPDSDLTRLNKAAPGVWVDTHPSTIEVLRASNELFTASGGAFDIRCGAALVDRGILPSFRREPASFRHPRLRGDDERRSATFAGVTNYAARNNDTRKRHQFTAVSAEIRGGRARKTGPWVLDLGGIAKGFAVDRAVEKIRRLTQGARVSGMVNAGGDLRAWGDRPELMAIRIPGSRRDHAWRVPVKDTAAATSSVRARSSGPLAPAAHVRMPGASLLAEPKTATVFAEQCMMADALTKVVLVRSDIARACLASYGAKALVFGADGRLVTTIG